MCGAQRDVVGCINGRCVRDDGGPWRCVVCSSDMSFVETYASIEVNADMVCVGAAVCVYWNTINMADADMLLSGIQRRPEGVLHASLSSRRTCQTDPTIYRHLNCSLSPVVLPFV